MYLRMYSFAAFISIFISFFSFMVCQVGRIAYMRTDGYFQPCATVMRAIDEAKAALQSKGYELVPFEHPQGHFIHT